jgi:hypothetical protein
MKFQELSGRLSIQAFVLLHVTRFPSLGDVESVLGADSSSNGKKCGDFREKHDDYRDMMVGWLL